MTNEQRAHDLAIEYAKLYANIQLSHRSKDSKEINIDLYAIYKESYFSILESLSKDFPTV